MPNSTLLILSKIKHLKSSAKFDLKREEVIQYHSVTHSLVESLRKITVDE